ncbi:ABC transporter substrate-binding protein [Brevibacillus sp. B_LB10_24]|uniref:ABC transporter substrate-binding protein n=1 Tax=Brevibacillus sp. B_LB10_24 TaxID=3380645 RepID=UPI0038BCB565
MRKKMYRFCFIMLAVFLAAGCSSAGTKEEASGQQPEMAAELRVAINAQPTSLDPHQTTASMTSVISRNIFETLMTLNAKYEPVPMLAESVEVSPDSLTYTFTLRQGVKFHNGKEMKAEDVAASMTRWLNKSSIAKKSLGEDAAFTADGDYKVVLSLKKVSSGVLNAMATAKQLAAIYPKEAIDSADSSGNLTEFIGTGPYRFEEWKQDQYIHLSKFADYVGRDGSPDGLSGSKAPKVQDLYFDVVTDPSTRLSGVKTGMYDIAMNIQPEHYEQLKSDPSIETVTDQRSYEILNFNKKTGPLTDVRIRKAISAALDLDSIMYGAFGNKDLYDIYPGFMKKNQKFYSEAASEFYNRKDPELAKQLLKEAGYNNEPIVLMTSRDYDHFYQAATVIQQQLQNIGMNIKLDVYDWPTFLDLENKPESWDMETTGYTTWITPAENIIFNSNSPGWTSDPGLDKIIDSIKSSTSDDELQADYDKLSEFLLKDYVPGVKLGNFNDIYAVNKKVTGFSAFEGMVLWNTGKEE